MSLISIILCALLISTAKSLRNCEDCMTLRECPQAHQQALNNYTAEFRIKYDNARCQKLGDIKVRICCSDFNEDGLNSRFNLYEGSDSNEVEKTNNEDEIENHRNIHLLTKECGQIDGSRIIGGTIAKLNEFPWLVLISRTANGGHDFYCGGTLINPRYVLTAAHCLKDYNVISVRVGEHDISQEKACYGPRTNRQCESDVQDILVSHKIIYPLYVNDQISKLVTHDIGLLRLKRPVDLTVVNAGLMCLPVARRLRELDLIGLRGTVAGWGRTNEYDQNLSDVLQKVEVPLSSPDTCKELYLWNRYGGEYDQRFQNILCADEHGSGSCMGDSGGPLMIQDDDDFKYVQYGIVSYGMYCGADGPSVYTDVSKYMKWILDTIKP